MIKSIQTIIADKPSQPISDTINDILTYLDKGADDPDGNLVISIGSSLTAQGLLNSSGSFGNSGAGPVQWAQILDRQAWRHYDAAISGQTTAEMLNRLQSDVLVYRPGCVIAQCGTNEIGNGYDDLIASSQEMFDRILANGSRLIICSIQTRSKTDSSWDDDDLETAAAVNEWRRAYAESHSRAYFCDLSKYVADPDDAEGEPLSGMLRDGTHYTPKGAFAAGKAISEITSQIFPPVDVIQRSPLLVDGVDYLYGVVSKNPTLLGTGGYALSGTTGTIPTDLRTERVSGTTTGAVASTLANRSTLDPTNVLTMTFTPGGASGDESFYFRTNTANTTISDDEYYEALIDLDVSGWAGWKEISFEIDDTNSGSPTTYGISNSYNEDMPLEAWSGIVRTLPFKIVGDARLRLRTVIDSAAVGTGVIKASNMMLRKLNPTSLNDMVFNKHDSWS